MVAPPNYAPDLISIQTMYDVLYDTYQVLWIDPFDPIQRQPSFTEHIYPMLRRFCDMQWVNYGFHVQYGWGAPHDFLRPSYLAQLASAGPEYAEVRLQVFNMFRNPASQTLDVDGWPQIYGDDMDLPATSARQYLSLTQTQYTILQSWAAGHFKADWDPSPPPPAQRIEDVPLASQPAHARPGRADVLPGRAVSPWLRDDLADAARQHVLRAVPHPNACARPA